MEISQLPQTAAPSQGSQSQCAAELERLISNRTAGRIRGLRVEPVGECLVLTGRTTTYYIKQLASQIALDFAQPFTLTNDIEVD